MQSYVLCSILCSLHGELVSDPASGLDLWAMADNDSAMGFEQLVPIEEHRYSQVLGVQTGQTQANTVHAVEFVRRPRPTDRAGSACVFHG